MTLAAILGLDNAPHGIVEGQAEDLDMEVNGIAGELRMGTWTYVSNLLSQRRNEKG